MHAVHCGGSLGTALSFPACLRSSALYAHLSGRSPTYHLPACSDEVPLIYHLDVAAMYPNIILTNRLQPSSIVTGGRASQLGVGNVCSSVQPKPRCAA